MFIAEKIQLLIFDFDGVLGESKMKGNPFTSLSNILSQERLNPDHCLEQNTLARLKEHEHNEIINLILMSSIYIYGRDY